MTRLLLPLLALLPGCVLAQGCQSLMDVARILSQPVPVADQATVDTLFSRFCADYDQVLAQLRRQELVLAPLSGLLRNGVVAFEASECPAGWDEYKPAAGRFVRGLDKQGSIDPDGRRAPGSLQQDAFAEHRHDRPLAVYDAGGGPNASWVASARHFGYGHVNPPQTGPAGQGQDTRPKNVALLYCRPQ